MFNPMTILRISIFCLLSLVLVSAQSEYASIHNHITASDDVANTTLTWFNLEIYPTPISISDSTAAKVIEHTVEVLNTEFVDVYYNFKKFKFENPINTQISRPRERQRHLSSSDFNNGTEETPERTSFNPTLRNRSRNAASRDTSSLDQEIELSDKSRYLQDTLNSELGTAVTFSGHIIFFFQPVQSKLKVDKEIIATINSPQVNAKIIHALAVKSGDSALEDVYFVKAVPYASQAPSVAPSLQTFSEFPTNKPAVNLVSATDLSTMDSASISNNSRTSRILYPSIAIAGVSMVFFGIMGQKLKKRLGQQNNYDSFEDNDSAVPSESEGDSEANM